MADERSREPAHDPQDLERLLVLRERAGDVDGMAFGDQRQATISGDLALTSTRSPDGSVSSEIARRQTDGTWLWVIDLFSIA
jgi:hypothetical protein